MNALHLLLWVALPYIAITVFIAGHIWRYRTDQYGWTTRSTQLLESRKLKWGSILFHYGALAAIGGHVLGILVPASWTSASASANTPTTALRRGRHARRDRVCCRLGGPRLAKDHVNPRPGHH